MAEARWSWSSGSVEIRSKKSYVIRIGPMGCELEGPGPILKNSSICVITGPLAFWTTSRSEETSWTCFEGSPCAACPFALLEIAAAAVPINARRPQSRRLTGAGVGTGDDAGEHVWQVV